jgi:hypothetical protein
MFEMYVYDPQAIVPRDPWDARAPSLARTVKVRIVDRDQRRQFVREHRTCVFGYARKDHGPAMTVVYYVMNSDDELLVSTMAARAKARAVGLMAGQEVPASRRPQIAQMAAGEQRVVIRVRPYATFETPPRHVWKMSDIDTLTHATSTSMPW